MRIHGYACSTGGAPTSTAAPNDARPIAASLPPGATWARGQLGALPTSISTASVVSPAGANTVTT